MTNGRPTEHMAPQHLWPDYAQARAQQAQVCPPATAQPGSPALGLLGLLLGLAALVAPFLPPVEMTGVRQYGTVLLAMPGLAFAFIGLGRHRRARPAAAIALVINIFALAILTPLAIAFP
ncbi:hypothetical protein ACXJJ3_04140 [Kribbella sp. WER1]